MKSQVLLRRYTQGLINTVEDQVEFDALYRDLSAFAELLNQEKKLKETFHSPFLPTSKRVDIARAVLDSVEIEDKARRFILLLVEKNRLGLFDSMIATLPVHWNEEQGITTFEVSSVVPLSETQKTTLNRKLEMLEKRSVDINYKIDPSIIGGLSIRKGNIVYDVSIEGSLNRLKETLSE